MYYSGEDLTKEKLKTMLESQGFSTIQFDDSRNVYQSPSGDFQFGFEIDYSDRNKDSLKNHIWLFNMFTNYDSNVDFFLQQDGNKRYSTSQGEYQTSIVFSEKNKNKYFISIKDKRIIIIVKNQDVYFSAYIGEFDSYCSKTIYPKPWVILGSSGYHLQSYNANSTYTNLREISNITGSGISSSFFKNFHGEWELIRTTSNFQTYEVNYSSIYPFNIEDNRIKSNIDGSFTVFPSILMGPDENDPNNDSKFYFHGELDVFYVPGLENSSENEISILSEDYICFPYLFSDNFKQFFAIKKD